MGLRAPAPANCPESCAGAAGWRLRRDCFDVGVELDESADFCLAKISLESWKETRSCNGDRDVVESGSSIDFDEAIAQGIVVGAFGDAVRKAHRQREVERKTIEVRGESVVEKFAGDSILKSKIGSDLNAIAAAFGACGGKAS